MKTTNILISKTTEAKDIVDSIEIWMCTPRNKNPLIFEIDISKKIVLKLEYGFLVSREDEVPLLSAKIDNKFRRQFSFLSNYLMDICARIEFCRGPIN